MVPTSTAANIANRFINQTPFDLKTGRRRPETRGPYPPPAKPTDLTTEKCELRQGCGTLPTVAGLRRRRVDMNVGVVGVSPPTRHEPKHAANDVLGPPQRTEATRFRRRGQRSERDHRHQRQNQLLHHRLLLLREN